MRDEEGQVERRSSSRRPIPHVLVELRKDVDAEAPDWVERAVDISSGGVLLQLPRDLGLRELLRITFSLGHAHTFSNLRAVVLRRELGDLGVLLFTAWPLHKQEELREWLRVQSFRAAKNINPWDHRLLS